MRRAQEGLAWPSSWAVIAVALAGLYPVADPDSFGHLSAGRQIATRGHVPSLDTFSYFRPTLQPWVNCEWLSDLLAFGVFRGGGFAGLNVLTLALIAAACVVVVTVAFARKGRLAARVCALALVAAVPALRVHLSARPQMFGFLLSALYWLGLLAILDGTEQRRARRWVLGLGCAHVLWVNLHGSHVLGVALTLIALAVSAKKPATRTSLLELLGLEAIASCISPYGPKIAIGALELVFDSRYRSIVAQWGSWNPQQPLWFALAIVLQAILVALAWRGLPRSSAGYFQRSAAVLLLLMAACSLRFIPELSLLTAPIVAEGIAPRLGAFAHDTRRSLAAWLAGVAAVSGFAFWMSQRLPPYAAFGLGEDVRTLPAASADWLARKRPAARLFASMDDSSFTRWAAPNTQQLIDRRVAFYGPAHLLARIADWSDGAALQKTIEATKTDAVLVETTRVENQVALESMQKAKRFRLVMIENEHALFVRGGDTSEDDAIRQLQPGYSAPAILSSAADANAMRRELAALRAAPNASGYVAWVEAILALRPLARASGQGGFNTPLTRNEHAAVDFALEHLRPLGSLLNGVPSVSVYRAIAATLACELDEANDALSSIAEKASTRESTYAAQELALRRGRTEEVRAFVSAVRARREAANDPWLDSLERGVALPNPCSAARPRR